MVNEGCLCTTFIYIQLQCVMHRNLIDSGILCNDSLQVVAGKSSLVYMETQFTKIKYGTVRMFYTAVVVQSTRLEKIHVLIVKSFYFRELDTN